jgi:hypothetical protein
MSCKNCKSTKLNKIINLDKQPISSVFPKKPKEYLRKYSLDLYECEKCKLVQFKKLAPLSEMYGETYGYTTSLSPMMIRHMKEKYTNIIKKKNNKKKFKNVD